MIDSVYFPKIIKSYRFDSFEGSEDVFKYLHKLSKIQNFKIESVPPPQPSARPPSFGKLDHNRDLNSEKPHVESGVSSCLHFASYYEWLQVDFKSRPAATSDHGIQYY